MSSGANAQRGDIVRNLTTGRIGEVTDAMNSGRILVKSPVTGGVEKWERWNCSIEPEYEPEECEGHPAGEFDPMGVTVYCDGSCLN